MYVSLTCTLVVGIHPGLVEAVLPIELTISWVEAHQARRSCASSLETFTQSFFPSCVAEDSRSGDRFQVCPERGYPRLQMASSSHAPCAMRCGQKQVLDQPGRFCYPSYRILLLMSTGAQDLINWPKTNIVKERCKSVDYDKCFFIIKQTQAAVLALLGLRQYALEQL